MVVTMKINIPGWERESAMISHIGFSQKCQDRKSTRKDFEHSERTMGRKWTEEVTICRTQRSYGFCLLVPLSVMVVVY
ncbi:Uncharacterized protein TCM_011863 [Theobroma cacao]|uniref:Uncharacterized protein n=1 Tax=Theobroma cacao TaxID=3641 RepID=A0A061ECK4_THECC|nr:Uncharacterized protein TCM_011863 [Theobroma cacao]